MSRLGLIFLSTWLATCLGCGANNQIGLGRAKNKEDESTTKLRTSYAAVAKRIAHEHRNDPNTNPPSLSSSRLIAESKSLIVDLKQHRGADTELQFICDEAIGATEESIAATQQLERLPKPPGEFEQFLMGFFYGYSFDFSGAANYSNRVQDLNVNIQSELVRLAQAMDRGHAATLLLPRIAKKIAGPSVSSSPVKVDFDETWGFVGSDWITLSNISGKNLKNATIVVDIEGQSQGVTQRHTNVHFVSDWSAGNAIYAKYDDGVTLNNRTFGRRTCSNVTKVIVNVYSDELSYEGYSYNYTASEMNFDITRYVDKLFKPRASYRPFDKGILFADTQRAIRLDFKGCSMTHLRDVSIKVIFKSGTLTSTKTTFRSFWKSDEELLIEFPDIWWDPKEANVEMTFNANNPPGVTRTYQWTWNR